MRGSPVPPEKVEEVVATAIMTDNKAETGRVLGMPRETVDFATAYNEMNEKHIKNIYPSLPRSGWG